MDARAVYSVVAAAIGGLAIKVWDVLRDRRRDRREASALINSAEIMDLAQFRRELWEEIEELRNRLDAMQLELDTSRRAYVELLGEHVDLKARHNQLERDHESLQAKYDVVKRELDDLRDRRL